MKQRYEMTEEDLKALLAVSKPTPVMYLSGGIPMTNSPQQNANRAWKKLGRKMRFEWDTVEPSREGMRVFYAEPTP